MWNIINSSRGKLINRKSNEKTGPSAEDFNDFFTNIANNLLNVLPQSNIDPLHYLHSIERPGTEFSFREVTFNEVRSIINHLNNKKSADIYGLTVPLIKSIKNLIVVPITKLINSCIRTGIFPHVLKRALITPIFKKGDKSHVSNFRPISLLPVISKIFERALASQLVDFFETQSLFSGAQYGFRRGKSTVLAILDLFEAILNSFEDCQHLSALFCDLSKAFDCVSYDILLDKLRHYNFSANSVMLIRSYLSERLQSVSMDGVSSAELQLTVGVPQGSVLGPILFLIYINDLPSCMPDAGCVLFADDTTIHVTGRTEDEVAGSLALARSHAEEWFLANRLLLNADKTQSALFSLRELASGDIRRVKFLGVTFDTRLVWDGQVEGVCARLRSSVFVLRNLTGCVSIQTITSAYYALFHSIMSYSAIAWGGSSHASRVFGLQRRAIRLMSGLGYREDCRAAFAGMGILTFPSLYILQNLMLIKRNEGELRSHEDCHRHNTRNKQNLVTRFCRLKRCQSRPDFIGIRLFNKLPHNVRTLTLMNLKKKCKEILITNAFYSVDEFFNFNF